jgi:hypothetical protein
VATDEEAWASAKTLFRYSEAIALGKNKGQKQ